ncbi:response regulator [bacterium (Candidatus Gribaldobacteria) CG03_land_8_20_14_0_80_36_40]|uniref:Response regulator n=1 Tax=bacterium (Candidatus Gribaldobacteria) CG03_land_8_20_14_0_80_36_40 TaxID=2014271 RepID=A0A2M7BZB9_9BACT|nr:MAG: response regulator [bacterium (Candidatus Gribaldobacteria) CG03_land_8_20_14_0_80_36_40]
MNESSSTNIFVSLVCISILVSRIMKKILFIEDESALQKTFGDILKNKGYGVLKALDGESGLRSAKGERPDLILLDLILPKMDGFEVLKELKENEETKNIPVIILTNLEETEDIQKALELGATTYLVKSSYTLEEVVNKIEKALGE